MSENEQYCRVFDKNEYDVVDLGDRFKLFVKDDVDEVLLYQKCYYRLIDSKNVCECFVYGSEEIDVFIVIDK